MSFEVTEVGIESPISDRY